MMKVKQSELRNFVKFGLAKDITSFSLEQSEALRNSHNLEIIGLSKGTNGLNGALLLDETGASYAITKRNTVLDYFV